MKHVLFRLAVVTLGLMLLAGCIRIVPLAPREEAEQTVLDAICSSVYVDPDADEGEEIAQFIFVGDTLLCEVTETLAAYYAEEIIPDDPSALFAPAADGAPIPVTLRQFSGFSMFGEYWGDGARLQMQLTDDGIVFRTENGAEFRRTRSDGTPPPRTTDARQSEIEARLGAPNVPDELCGSWTCREGDVERILILREDDSFWCLYREPEHPVRVYVGACRIDEDGILRAMAGRVGWADVPFEGAWSWELTGDGLLLLRSDEPDDPLLACEAETIFRREDVTLAGVFSENGGE